jgi:ElaB/YqjD/DUF883 family membrane-anchored ribosome-binding protein
MTLTHEVPPMISLARDDASSQSAESGSGGEILIQAQEYLAEAGDIVKNFVNNRPAMALGAALAVGVVLGWLIKRR